jgi:hypothetical protein
MRRSGYALVVNYAPGTMKGAVVAVGEERVVLDGSGRAVIGQTPRVRASAIAKSSPSPGAAGFDTDRLDFNIEAS